MLLIKNEKDYTVYVQYRCNSGWCTICSIHVVAKNNETVDCEKIADKLFKKYKKDMRTFYNDIEEFGDILQKAQVRN